ncbi:MAG: type II methionyl aminopeptidase [Nanoarchaeota archaeon]|nr:type II methionyl aminopeptidase [Nanoarchaeota archaeon]
MPTKQELDIWRKAGKASSEVKKYAKTLIKKGASIVDIADKIEKEIYKYGKPSFPVNIAINEKAAHYAPLYNDKTILADDIVKVDFGVSIDGYPTDTAFTIDLSGKNASMMRATEKALQEAIKLATPGRKVCEIGRKVHETITQQGFSPIRNLSGHEIQRYTLHAGLSIPNYDNGNETILEENMIIAIEPFSTTGTGIVKDGKESGDYSLIEKKPVRDANARKILEFIEKEYSTLPFAGRWIYNKFGLRGMNSLRLLCEHGIVKNYNELIEISKKPVIQFENTVLVKDKPEILTE